MRLAATPDAGRKHLAHHEQLYPIGRRHAVVGDKARDRLAQVDIGLAVGILAPLGQAQRDRGGLRKLLARNAQTDRQIGVLGRIERQHAPLFTPQHARQRTGNSRLADAALARDCQLHQIAPMSYYLAANSWRTRRSMCPIVSVAARSTDSLSPMPTSSTSTGWQPTMNTCAGRMPSAFASKSAFDGVV